MKPARLIVGFVALAAGVGAMMMFGKSPPPQIQMIQAAPSMETDDIMVAAHDIPMGSLIGDGDLTFQAWPKASTSPNAIRRNDGPNVVKDIEGSVTRANFLAGEPIRRDKLVKGPSSGFLSAILPSGSRAIAINIDTRGSSSAGNFILPNDRVDIIHTFRDGEASKAGGADVYVSNVLLANIRVLAIGPNIQEKNGDRVVAGDTATLELNPRQANIVTLAQRVGQLSLSLRSMLDFNQPTEPVKFMDDETKHLTIVRYGIASRVDK